MNRLDIADYLGLTIETVCRVFSKFKRDGLLSVEGRHRVVLRSMGTLAKLAGEMEGTRISDFLRRHGISPPCRTDPEAPAASVQACRKAQTVDRRSITALHGKRDKLSILLMRDSR